MKWIIVLLLLLLVFACPALAMADSVGITATPNWTSNLPLPPTHFTLTMVGNHTEGELVSYSVNATWVIGLNATNTILVESTDGYPSSTTDGTVVYNGTGNTTLLYGLVLDTTTYYYSAWSWNAFGYSTDHATGKIGGENMFLLLLALIPLGLTIAMVATKNSILGFPGAMFWGAFGGLCYTTSVATWDLYYIVFFASMGMVIFSMFGAYTLRKKDLSGPDADKGAFIDEKNRTRIQYADDYGETGEEDPFDIDKLPMHGIPESALRPSRYQQRFHDRAQRRKATKWGDLS